MARGVVLITGASGYIGRALVDRLSDQYRIIGLDRSVAKDVPGLEASYAIDLADEASVVDALTNVRAAHSNTIAACIHLAAYFDITGEPNPLYTNVNVEGSRRLITALQDFDVEQFIYASSMLVHEPKPLPGVRIDESSPLTCGVETSLPCRLHQEIHMKHRFSLPLKEVFLLLLVFLGP